MNFSPQQKIKSRQELVGLCDTLRSQGKLVGYTSGVFDLLHAGHVEYLTKARELCDVLILGLNSDSSVKQNKGDSRPINSESNRALVVAGLTSVSYVFIFEDKNNNANVELLKPNLYIKAGDYNRDKLSSASIVEKFGGKVEIIPTKEGFSTTKILERIQASAPCGVETVILPEKTKAPAIFVDRDGTIIQHVEYLSEPHKVQIFDGALETLKNLQGNGYRIVMITNQPGIGLGYFTREDFFRVNRVILKAAGKIGLAFDKVYFCPHSDADNCPCRKPKTGMLDRAKRELNIEMANSYVIGDMTLDVMLAKNAGVKSILVSTGQGGADGRVEVKPDLKAASLSQADSLILAAKVK